MTVRVQDEAPAGPLHAEPTTPLPVIPSQELLRGLGAVFIEHQGQRYRLQATRQGKLILTK